MVQTFIGKYVSLLLFNMLLIRCLLNILPPFSWEGLLIYR